MTYAFTMKANPGGQIDSKAVVGRDRLIHILWETLEQQSLVITAERRIGKKLRLNPSNTGKQLVPEELEVNYCVIFLHAALQSNEDDRRYTVPQPTRLAPWPVKLVDCNN